MKKILLAVAIFFYSATSTVFSQSLAINIDGSTANASALLDVKSTLKGMLIPRMSRTERNAIASPATGLLIFQNAPDSIGFYYYNGSSWTWMFSNSNADTLAWRTGGNTGTIDGNHFIGTKDNIPFNIRVNNQKAGRIDHISWNSFYGYQSGNVVSSGIHNTAMGYQSLISNTTGNNNTAIGTLAGNSNTTGDQNTMMGYGAMYDNTVGIYNTAYGFYALYQNKAGSNATAIGVQSMLYANNTTTPFINNNVAVGYESLKGNAPASGNTGLNNTALGYQTLFNNSSASNNTAVGLYALNQNTTSGRNTAVGSNALYTQSFSNSNTAWNSDNIAIGDSALYANQPTATTNAYQNTAVGNRSLRTNTIGWQNTALGTLSLFSNTIGQLNTGTGWASLYKNADGFYNTAVGAMAMYYNVSGGYNVGVGTVALHHNVSGSGNTAVGQQAGLGTAGNSFSYNTILGYQSGYNLTTGSNNVFIGNQAGYNVTSGSNKLYIANNTADPPLIYGDFASGRLGLGTIIPNEKLEVNGNLLLTGTGTIYTGAGTTNMTIRSGDGTGSGGTMTIRGGNAGTGTGGAGGNITIQGGANMPSGGAGYGGLGVPGVVNILGSYGYNTVGGAINITAGATSCWSLVSGSHADVNITGGTNLAATDASSIVVEGGYTIGTSCPSPGATGGNLILKSGIASGTGTAGNIQLLNGNVGIGTSAPSSKLEVCGNVRVIGTIVASGSITTSAISCPSDLRYKKNIAPFENPIEKIMQVNAVQYNWRKEAFPNMNFNDQLQTGFIAQDIEKIFPEMVFTDDNGYRSIDYSRLTPVLLAAVKEQQKQITIITNKLTEIEKLLHK